MLTEKLNRLCAERELPYLDLRVYQGYDPVYHYLRGDDGSAFLQMYSMSKAVTVVSAMKLVEAGKLALTDPVDKFFPEFFRTTYCRDGEILPNPNRMTVWNLLTMTSGLSYDVATEQILDVTRELGQGALLRDYVKAFAKTPLSFPTGEAFQYSLSHDLLAAVIENVSGMNFAEFAKKFVFEPLEMVSSTFYNVEEGIFPMFVCDDERNVTQAPVHNDLLLSDAYISGGAGMNTTLEDYAKLIKALANDGLSENGVQILREETVRAIREPLLSHEFVKADFNWQGDDYGYGLGVRVREGDTDWGLSRGEFGWDGAAGSFWLVDPERKVSIVMGMNILSWEKKHMGIHMEITEMIYRALFN